MKIETQIDVVQNRYCVQVGTCGFTAIEEQQLAEFGEPTIDVGGTIAGSLGRPGQTNTVVTITGGGGSGATATVSIVAGVITGIVVVTGGTGYTSTPTVTVTGDGTGFVVGTVTIASTAITAITVTAGGTGWHVVPITISLVFPSSLRRIKSDMPVTRVFDLNDSPNADVYAQFYATTIASRLTAAKQALMLLVTNFVGETVTTV